MWGTKTMKNNLDELKSTLEEIRSAKYPDVPKELIDAIVDIQSQNQDNPAKRQGDTQKLIIQYANQLSVEGDHKE